MRAIDLKFRPPRAAACRIRVGRGLLARLADDLAAEAPGRRIVLISDDNVAPLYGEPLRARLHRRGLRADLLTFPAGESNKTRTTKENLENGLFDLRVGRRSVVVSVGGGVSVDLAGFVAATWHRGIPVVHVPTSLLAMVDAAVGGKTAVNLPGGKNLIGAFHQPLAVYADVETLATLPDTVYVDGFAEAVKAAVVADAALFDRLERDSVALLGRSASAVQDLVARCLEIKGRVACRDERDVGPRAALNFGHTIGHALESCTGHTLRHGSAVSIGMCVEADLATLKTGFPPRDRERLDALLRAFGLPVELPRGVSAKKILDAARRDKKAHGAGARYALPERIGRISSAEDPTVEIDESEVGKVLAQRGAGGVTPN